MAIRGRRTGRSGRVGDYLVFCSRGHNCWASEARKKWDGHWVCEYHWEEQHPIDRLPARAQDEHQVVVTRGQDKALPGEFKAGVCPHHSAVAGVAIAGCAIAGQSGIPASGTHISPDADKPSTFTLETGTVTLA